MIPLPRSKIWNLGHLIFVRPKNGLKNTVLVLTSCKGQNDIFKAILWVPQRVMLHILARGGAKIKNKIKILIKMLSKKHLDSAKINFEHVVIFLGRDSEYHLKE